MLRLCRHGHRATYQNAAGGGLQNAPILDKSNGMGAGSLYSTLGDMHLWTLALFGGKLLSAASVAKMTTAVDGDYGYGLVVNTTGDGRRTFSHGGSVPGFTSFFVHYPESRVTVVVLKNTSMPTTRGEQPAAILVTDWLATLAHGGTVSLSVKR